MTNFFYANALDGCAGRPADIVNFWSQAKRHLYRFNGIQRDSFHLFLKECEWRFQQDDHGKLMDQLEEWIAGSKT
jgi:transposase-like protein